MIADPRAVAARWPDARLRTLAGLAATVTETPWTLTGADRAAAHAVGLTDEHLVHAVALSAYFGHLNRIADVTEVPLDYPVANLPPRAEPATPPLAPAPHVVTEPAASALALAARPATAAALAAWHAALFERDTANLPRATRAALADHVAHWLGAGPAPTATVDADLVELARAVTLAPWALGDPALAPLRARGWTDAALFDACITTSTATVIHRITVALRALGQ